MNSQIFVRSEIDASKLAEGHRVTVVEAEPGAGKTTTLQFIAWQQADGQLGDKPGHYQVPVYVELKLLLHRSQTIEAAVQQALHPAIGEAGPIPWDSLLLLVDGVNGVTTHLQTSFKAEVRDLLSRFSKLRVIIAGRPNPFRGEFEARIVVLQRLTDKQLANLFRRVLGDAAWRERCSPLFDKAPFSRHGRGHRFMQRWSLHSQARGH